MKLAILLILCSVALCFGNESKEIKINLNSELGTVVKEKRFPNSEVFIVYIKQRHKTPQKEVIKKTLKDDFAAHKEETDCVQSKKDLEKNIGTALEAITRENHEACLRINVLQNKALSMADENPVEIQRNIYAILKSLKNDGLQVVGLEGGYANEDAKFVVPTGDSKDIRASCRQRYPKIVEKCEKVSEDVRFEKGNNAGQVFEAYYAGDILTVGVEDGKIHSTIYEDVGTEFSTGKSRYSKKEKEALNQKREEAVVKNLVEKMRKNKKTFGAIIFGSAHEKTLPVNFEKMGVSYAIVEPAMLPSRNSSR